MKTENQLFYESLPDHDIPGLAHRDLIYLFRRWKTFPKTEAEQDHYYQEVSDVLYLIRRSIRIGRDCKHPMASTRKMIEMLFVAHTRRSLGWSGFQTEPVTRE